MRRFPPSLPQSLHAQFIGEARRRLLRIHPQHVPQIRCVKGSAFRSAKCRRETFREAFSITSRTLCNVFCCMCLSSRAEKYNYKYGWCILIHVTLGFSEGRLIIDGAIVIIGLPWSSIAGVNLLTKKESFQSMHIDHTMNHAHKEGGFVSLPKAGDIICLPAGFMYLSLMQNARYFRWRFIGERLY